MAYALLCYKDRSRSELLRTVVFNGLSAAGRCTGISRHCLQVFADDDNYMPRKGQDAQLSQHILSHCRLVRYHPAHACGAFAVRRGQQRLQFGGLSKQGLLPSQVGGMGRSSVPGPGAGSGPGRQCR